MPKDRQRPVHKSSELRLLPCPSLDKDLLKLASCCGQRHSDCVGGHLQAFPLRNGYRDVRFSISQIESSPQRLDRRIVRPIGVDDEDNAPYKLARQRKLWVLRGYTEG